MTPKPEKTLFEAVAHGRRTYHNTKKGARDAAKGDADSIIYRCVLPNLGAATLLAVLNGEAVPARKTVVSGELPLLKLMQDSEPISDGVMRLGHVRSTTADSPKYGRIVVEFDVGVEATEGLVAELRGLQGQAVQING
jgi:hypothetical protein